MNSKRAIFAALTVLVLTMLPLTAMQAQQPSLGISLLPQSGPPGTKVTVVGRGAPPNAAVVVLYAPFDDLADCRTEREMTVVAETTADADGQFAANHIADQTNEQQAGYTYLAKINEGSDPRASSNLECFTFTAPPADSRRFPETGYTVRGRFLEFWDQHGGLPVFGYPISGQISENDFDVQYFERARFELHPENAAPYDVLLGRLGDELLLLQGIDWQQQPQATEPAPGCLYFSITGHNVCDQATDAGFLSYWRSHGLEFDGQSGTSTAESLALFGNPLTEPYTYTNSSGDTVLVQWFERARFEWHPDNPAEFKVLLGRLGTEIREQEGPNVPTQ